MPGSGSPGRSVCVHCRSARSGGGVGFGWPGRETGWGPWDGGGGTDGHGEGAGGGSRGCQVRSAREEAGELSIEFAQVQQCFESAMVVAGVAGLVAVEEEEGAVLVGEGDEGVGEVEGGRGAGEFLFGEFLEVGHFAVEEFDLDSGEAMDLIGGEGHLEDEVFLDGAGGVQRFAQFGEDGVEVRVVEMGGGGPMGGEAVGAAVLGGGGFAGSGPGSVGPGSVAAGGFLLGGGARGADRCRCGDCRCGFHADVL